MTDRVSGWLLSFFLVLSSYTWLSLNSTSVGPSDDQFVCRTSVGISVRCIDTLNFTYRMKCCTCHISCHIKDFLPESPCHLFIGHFWILLFLSPKCCNFSCRNDFEYSPWFIFPSVEKLEVFSLKCPNSIIPHDQIMRGRA